jgi:hypothetical protein
VRNCNCAERTIRTSNSTYWRHEHLVDSQVLPLPHLRKDVRLRRRIRRSGVGFEHAAAHLLERRTSAQYRERSVGHRFGCKSISRTRSHHVTDSPYRSHPVVPNQAASDLGCKSDQQNQIRLQSTRGRRTLRAGTGDGASRADDDESPMPIRARGAGGRGHELFIPLLPPAGFQSRRSDAR